MPLTTGMLSELILSGVPVYAFEPYPLRRSDPRALDGGSFSWIPDMRLDLDPAISGVRARYGMIDIPQFGSVRLYRAETGR